MGELADHPMRPDDAAVVSRRIVIGDDAVIRYLTYRATSPNRHTILDSEVACSIHDATIFDDDVVVLDHDVVKKVCCESVVPSPNVIGSRAIVVGDHDVVTWDDDDVISNGGVACFLTTLTFSSVGEAC